MYIFGFCEGKQFSSITTDRDSPIVLADEWNHKSRFR